MPLAPIGLMIGSGLSIMNRFNGRNIGVNRDVIVSKVVVDKPAKPVVDDGFFGQSHANTARNTANHLTSGCFGD